MKMSSKYYATSCTLALLGSMMLPAAALAEQVTLKSSDGTINLVGEFIEFKDDNYIIRTALGDLRISASRVSCEGAACPDFGTTAADVAIVGSDTIGLGLMPLLLTGFADNKDAEAEITNPADNQALASLIGDAGFGEEIGSFLVSSTSTDAAFTSLLNDEAQIGMASRRILPAEAKELRAAGAGNMVSPDQERIIAVDSVVVVTHPSNPVKELTLEQLRGIYSGQITNWKELGGDDVRITVVASPEGTTTSDFFLGQIFEGQTPSFLPSAIAQDDQEMSNIVYSNRTAIGYVGFAFQRGNNPMTIVNECGIASRPDAFSAKTEEYPLSRRMYLYNRADNLDIASRDFLDFAVSEDADGVIVKSGFIDLGITRRKQDQTDARVAALTEASTADYEADFEEGIMKNMLAAMAENDRLSTTFRFRTGSSKIDEKAQADMNRLIHYLERFPQGTRITMVGFTDSVGAFEANLNLSIARAEQMMRDVRDASAGRLNHIEFASLGFGETAPSACNSSEIGKAINRRVEVWISKES